ncbi:MAG: hypothetical protein KJP00_10735, partial [Bacteroidia bacterium]|nr:hypothetical protein [Bacteroidia bacterium]
MKIKSGILLSLILLIGCQSKTTKKTANNNTRITPKEWVHYRAKDDVKNGHIVLISGDEEYRSEEALPQLAKILTHHHGFDCTVLFAQDPEKPGIIDPNYRQHIPGLDQLEEADLMIISTRFRSLPVEQMRHIDNYMLDG